MPPEAPAVTGPDAIREFLAKDVEKAKKAGTKLVAADDESVGVSGRLGFHNGSFKLVSASGSTLGTGKYLEVWHRSVDEKWQIIRDVWNADAPAAAPESATPATPPAP